VTSNFQSTNGSGNTANFMRAH